MKKILICTLLCALLLSLFGISASALTVEEINGISFTPGQYGCDDPADFSPVGTVKIDWDPDAAQKLDLTDGSMADWETAGYSVTVMDVTNIVSWVGDASAVPAGWSIKAYFVADSDNLYFGFSVTDPNFAYGSGGYYDGDVIQFCVDFGRKIGDQIDYDPDAITEPKNIFYSFSCDGDGAPISIMRRESEQDGFLTEQDGVTGSTSKTADGWCAEFSMSYDRLFDDYAWRAWDEDAKVYIGSNENLPLKIGCCLYYLDRSETAGEIRWAAGSTNGITFEDGTPGVSWTVMDNGIQLELDYVEGMVINSNGVKVILPEPFEETTENLTEPFYEFPVEDATGPSGNDTAAPAEDTRPVTELATEAETYPAWVTPAPEDSELRDAADDGIADKAEEIDAILEKYGCTATLGMGSLTALLALAVAAVALKKKH